MFDLTSLPDLLALAVLVFVFWSILRTRAGNELHAWLLGWIFILLHFAIGILGGDRNPLQTLIQCVAAIMLVLGGAAFIYAAGGGNCTRRLRWIASTGLLATLFYIGFEYYEVAARNYYYAAAALLFVSACAVLVPEHDRPPEAHRHRTMALWALLLAAVLALLAYRGKQDFGDAAILFVVYMLAGIQYWRNFHRRTTGALTAVAGLVAWAFVFPIGVSLQIFAPQIHVQSSVWNIPKYIVAIGILLTLLEEEIHRTEHLALHDPLTGLPNRRLLDDRLTKAVERAERNEGRVAVLLIDLDNFKQINDSYGHAVGDEVLRVVATRLHMRVRKADTIARTGGDEFVVVVSDLLQPHGAEVLAGKLMADLSEPIVMEAVNLCPSASIGVAIYPDDGQTAAELCDRADISMYGKKRADR
jgi:diguanylate cyclase (GGDEF)-like protein